MAKHRRRETDNTPPHIDYRSARYPDWSIKFSPIEDVPTFVLRMWLLLILLAIPWYFGFVTWQAQCWLIYSVLPLPFFILIGRIRNWFGSDTSVQAPILTYLLLSVALLGLLQSARLFESGTWEPNSVKLQRWALRETTTINGSLLSKESKQSIELVTKFASADAASQNSAKTKLASSVAPEKSLAAIGGLTVAAILCWSASIAFRNPASHKWLFLCLVLIGIVMSGIGMYQAIGQPVPLVEQIREGTPYGTFVSRNSAGGFLNVCLAGAIGLAGIAFATSSRQKVDKRYKIYDGNWVASTIGSVEDRLAMIDSKQMTTLVALALIAVGVFASASRGAIISMTAASIATLAMSTRLSKTRASWILGILVASLSIALLAALEIDTRIRDRFGMVFEDGVARSYIWEASYRAMQFFMATGSGLGTFHFAALPFQDSMMNGWFYHAENLIIEFFVESGWVGVLIFVWAVAVIFLRINRERPRGKDRTRLPILLAATYLIISCLVHNSVDFPLLVPAVFAPVAILFGTLFCDHSEDRSEKADTQDQRRSHTRQNKAPVQSKNIQTSSAIPSSTVDRGRVGLVQHLMATKSAKIVQYYGSVFAMLAFLMVSLTTLRELASAENFERQSAILADAASKDETRATEVTETAEQLGWNGESNIAESKRLRADSEMNDFRRELFDTLNESRSVDWKASNPSLFRLAVTRLVKENRVGEIALLAGGEDQLKRLELATDLYRSARQQSPLDWRITWGEFLGSWSSPREEQLHSIAVLTSITSNRPNILFTMATVANELDEQELCSQLLSATLRAAPSMATRVGLFLSQTRQDEEIELSIFPDQLDILESLAGRAFPKESFPKTNARLWQRIVNVSERLKPSDVTRWVWLAKSAKSANNDDLELTYLERAAELDRFNGPIQQRLAVLLANRGEFSRALSALNDCLMLNPSDSNALKLREQIKQMAEKSQDNSGNR